MKQINKLKLTAGMAISLLGAFFAESCDDNDYFGIDDDSFASGLYKDGLFLEVTRLKIPCTNSFDYDIIFGFVK